MCCKVLQSRHHLYTEYSKSQQLPCTLVSLALVSNNFVILQLAGLPYEADKLMFHIHLTSIPRTTKQLWPLYAHNLPLKRLGYYWKSQREIIEQFFQFLLGVGKQIGAIRFSKTTTELKRNSAMSFKRVAC